MGKKDGCHGPGEYLADVTEGIVDPANLPAPLLEIIHRDAKQAPCIKCGCMAHRLRRFCRRLHDLGDPRSGRPRERAVHGAQYHCGQCDAYFSIDLSDLCAARAAYTHAVVRLAIRLVVEDNLPYRAACWHLWRDHRVFVPFATIQNWVEAAGEKSGRAGPGFLPRSGPGKLQRLHRRG